MVSFATRLIKVGQWLGILFQTELICGIICNKDNIPYQAYVDKFQTELICGIICNRAKFSLFYGRLAMV